MNPRTSTTTMPPEASSPSTAGNIASPAERRWTWVLWSALAALTLLLVAIVALFCLLSRPRGPRFNVTAFSASGIAAGAGRPVALSGNLTVRNPSRDVFFLYDTFYLSVEYRGADVVEDQALTAAPLDQPPMTTSPLAFRGLNVSAAAAGGDMARDATKGGDRVELTVKVRSSFRRHLGYRGSLEWHPLRVACEVAVGHDGQLLPEYLHKRCTTDVLLLAKEE